MRKLRLPTVWWSDETQNQHRNFDALASRDDLQQLRIARFERARLQPCRKRNKINVEL
jgi:hypothetical protein